MVGQYRATAWENQYIDGRWLTVEDPETFMTPTDSLAEAVAWVRSFSDEKYDVCMHGDGRDLIMKDSGDTTLYVPSVREKMMAHMHPPELDDFKL